MSNTNTETPRRRGRKKIADGGKPSPRQIYCVCAALVGDNLVQEEVHCVDGDKDTPDHALVGEAKALFNTAHGQDPDDIKGPYFPRKGVNSKRQRDTLNISMEEVSFVPGKLGTAVYKGWNVSVRFIEENDDAAYIIYKTHTKEDKKTKPANKVVRLDALENLEDSPEA